MALPSGYTQIEYIESTGTQWIDTGVQIGSTGAVQARFRPGSLGSTYYEQRLCGAYDGTNRCFILYNCFNPAYLGVGTNDYTTGLAVTAGTDYSITCMVESAGTVQYDLNGSVTSVSYGGTIETGRNLYLFCCNENGSKTGFAKVRLYEFRLYDGSTKVRDLVPCINPNGAVGMYDEVSGAFFGNAGSGVFTAGPEIAEPGVSKVQLKDGTVLIDLTGDDVTEENVLQGVKFHDAMGRNLIGRLIQKAGGRQFARGTITLSNEMYFTIDGLSFTPQIFVLRAYQFHSNSNNAEFKIIVWDATMNPNDAGVSNWYGMDHTIGWYNTVWAQVVNSVSVGVIGGSVQVASTNHTTNGAYTKFNGAYEWYAIGEEQ